MPRLIYTIPDWGYDKVHMQKVKYQQYMKLDLLYIDTVESYPLYQLTSNGGFTKSFVLLDHTNGLMKYNSVMMDYMHTGRYSQCVVWRDKNDDTLKGISNRLITDYFIDILTTIYSDDTHTVHGKAIWEKLIKNSKGFYHGAYDKLNDIILDDYDFDELYTSADRDNLILFIGK